MKKMTCVRIETIEVMGVKLINAIFASSTGQVECKARAQTMDQFTVGQNYMGRMGYDAANNRTFKTFSKAI